MMALTKLYKELSLTKGSQFIASEFAVKKLIAIVQYFKISSILEVGLGIGSISTGILVLSQGLVKVYDGIEKNKFCLQSLENHRHKEKIRIFPELPAVPKVGYELVIIDGMDNELNEINQFISPTGIIAVEGDREVQMKNLKILFPNHKWVHSISLKKNAVYSPFPTEAWQGGIKFIFINPTKKQKLWWAKEKCLTFLKYQYPGRFLGKKNRSI